MTGMRTIVARLTSVFRRRRAEHELDEELHAHLDMLADENRHKGMTPEEARCAALREFGGVEQAKELYREQRGLLMIETLARDVRYGLRQLRRNPGFALVAVLTLALGVGANTAIFSVVNTVLLQPLPYKDASRLMTVWSYDRSRGFDTDQVSPLDFADWRTQNHTFESMAASTEAAFTLTGAGEPSLLIAYSFSADYFHVLGVHALLGRTFLAEEEEPGKNHVTVLSYALWKSRFGGDPAVVGRNITLDGAPYAVVGIMPPGFQYPASTQLWTPLTILPEAANDRAFRYLRIMARLKPGVTEQQAQVEMNTIARRLALQYPKTNRDDDATRIMSLRQMISGDIRPALLILLCAVGFVLLIACANVANLLLTRAMGRHQEVAVRAALGASRGRLIRQFLTESTLLAAAGGALGLMLAFWCTRALVIMFPPTIFNLSIPHLDKIPVDGWVLGFALMVSLLTGVIFGLVPALQAGGLNAGESLKESGRSLTGSAQGRRLRSALVVAEVALSLILLAAAGLTMKSFVHLLGGDLGFNPEHVLTLRVLLPRSKYETDAQQLAFGKQALDSIRSLPGVSSTGTVTFLPLSGWRGGRRISIAGRATPEDQRLEALWSSVTTDYFRTMEIPLLRGRFFKDQDDANAPPVGIVSKSLAQRLLPNQDPMGKRLDVDGLKGPVEVVGVVGDIHQLGLTSDQTSQIYLPFPQMTMWLMCFTIRTTIDPQALTKAAESAIWSVDEDQAVGYVMPMSELASESLAPQRVVALLLGGFAAMALLLAGVGLYGVIAYSVAQRTHEIGIRIALGAARSAVLRLVVTDGLKLTLVGLGLGFLGALGLAPLLGSQLYGVRPHDPSILGAVVILLAAVAALASYIPARRATAVDPMVALRHE